MGGTGSEFCIEISSGELRSVKGDTAAKIGWTRFARKNKGWGSPSARIDMMVAKGSQVGRWSLKEQRVAESSRGSPLSDHVMILFTREIRTVVPGQGRPKSVPICGKSKRDKEAREIFTDRTAENPHFDMELNKVVDGASAPDTTRTALLVDRLVELGWEAVAQADEQLKERARLAAGPNGGFASTKENYNSWMARLSRAKELIKSGIHPREASCPLLFHYKTGLGKLWGEEESATTAWDRVVRKCRREVMRASRAHAAKTREADKKARGCLQGHGEQQHGSG